MDDNPNCSVCFNSEDNDEIKIVDYKFCEKGCKPIICELCLKAWLEKNFTCPICSINLEIDDKMSSKKWWLIIEFCMHVQYYFWAIRENLDGPIIIRIIGCYFGFPVNEILSQLFNWFSMLLKWRPSLNDFKSFVFRIGPFNFYVIPIWYYTTRFPLLTPFILLHHKTIGTVFNWFGQWMEESKDLISLVALEIWIVVLPYSIVYPIIANWYIPMEYRYVSFFMLFLMFGWFPYSIGKREIEKSLDNRYKWYLKQVYINGGIKTLRIFPNSYRK